MLHFGARDLSSPFFLNSSTKLINKERQNQLYSYASFPGRFFWYNSTCTVKKQEM